MILFLFGLLFLFIFPPLGVLLLVIWVISLFFGALGGAIEGIFGLGSLGVHLVKYLNIKSKLREATDLEIRIWDQVKISRELQK